MSNGLQTGSEAIRTMSSPATARRNASLLRTMKGIHRQTGTAFLGDSSDMLACKEKRRPVKLGTYIARLIETIQNALSKLGVDVQKDPERSQKLIEGMAVVIHDTMSVSTRNYHSVQHVFDVSEGVPDDPIAILAALFHDCVYYHVDGGISDMQREKLQIYEDAFTQTDTMPEYRVIGGTGNSQDVLLRLVESIFGYPLNTVVTHQNGLNEFLSAVLAVRQLEPVLPLRTLAEIACCIEATIPFRTAVEDHYGNVLTAMDRLYVQMRVASSKFDLDMEDEEIIAAVQRAARMANEDVANFGTEDVLWFLDNTWNLLPETNEALRQRFLYSVVEFQFAVFKMYGFFLFLQPKVIFPSFRGVPSSQVLTERLANAARNLKLGRKYVGAKLLSLSVLAAFAELTGGDAPIALFMGDLPSRHRATQEPRCPLPKPAHPAKGDPVVYQILSEGRRSETSFDIRQSPLASYLYGNLGDDKVAALIQRPHPQWKGLYPMTTETATALLRALPKECVQCLGKSLGTVAVSRAELLEEVVQRITST
jgi:hypothetical protein